MEFLICIAALFFLMYVAYMGFSVILFAPIAALAAVLLTEPSAVLPVYSGLFMDKMVFFVQNYFPVFLLGALFGKVIEMSGFARSIVAGIVRLIGKDRAVLTIIAIGALLTYGGVSLFVVTFALYPFAAEMFRVSDMPKRLIPATIIIGMGTFTMDSLPGTPQIQNVIPTSFFKTDIYAAPILGSIGAIFILIVSVLYIEFRLRQARLAGEGYGSGHILEPEVVSGDKLVHPLIAISPLFVVGILNLYFTKVLFPKIYTGNVEVALTAGAKPITLAAPKLLAIWSVESALVVAILFVIALSFKTIAAKFADASKMAVSGALLASLNTASEYGFGSVMAALPGFLVIRHALEHIPNPLVNEAITITTLAGVTGSASGGMGIVLAAMSDQFIAAANAAGISMEVLHRVAAMASGGMDTLPHNGAIITVLAICGLTHKQSYRDIFALTVIKTTAAFLVIGVYYLTGLV